MITLNIWRLADLAEDIFVFVWEKIILGLVVPFIFCVLVWVPIYLAFWWAYLRGE